MENRSIFTLNSLGGMLIAVLLLLSVLTFLMVMAIGAQQDNASNFYKLDNEKEIQMFSTDSAKHMVDVK
ncbi:MAG TPA: DUF4006 family protein [Sulfuricurvum sp.]|nr:DUF4006 family protein [Sulfuricurvum sp.]